MPASIQRVHVRAVRLLRGRERLLLARERRSRLGGRGAAVAPAQRQHPGQDDAGDGDATDDHAPHANRERESVSGVIHIGDERVLGP